MDNILEGMKIALFGASRYGQEFAAAFKKTIYCFFDNNQEINQGGYCLNGIEVKAPYYDEDLYVIVTNHIHDIDMVSQLLELGYKKFAVVYRRGGAAEEEESYLLDYFDYSEYSKFEVENDKVALLCNGNSGSNTFCFYHMMQKYHMNSKLRFELLDTNQKRKDYYYQVFTSRFLISTMHVSSLKDKIIVQTYHSFSYKGIGYFDKSIVESSFERTHRDMLNSTYVLSYSPLYSILFSASFGLPRSRYRNIGVPRNDVMQLSNGREKMKRFFPALGDKRIILYMPTYRERTTYTDDETQGYLFDYPGFSRERLKKLLKDNNAVMIMKLHEGDTLRFSYLEEKSDELVLLRNSDFDRNEDFYEYLNGADILLTDYSSIFYDYLLLDRPIVFLHRDYDKYDEERGLLWEPASFWCPGPRVIDYDGFETEIKKLLSGEDSYKDKRHELCKVYHENRDAKASERLLRLLEETYEERYS